MKNFLITSIIAIGSALAGAYFNEKHRLGVKGRIDGCIDSVTGRNKSADAETTTGTGNSKAS